MTRVSGASCAAEPRAREPRARSGRRLALAAALLLPFGLGACDTVDSVLGDSPQPTTVQPQDTSGQPYPNLASVPDKPPPVSPEEIRARTAEGLAADRANAEYSSSLTASGTAQPAAPPPAAAAPAPAPAPASSTPSAAAPPVPSPSTPTPAGVPPAPPPQASAPPPPAGAAPQPAAAPAATPAPTATPAPAPAPAAAPQTAGTPDAEACALAEPWEKDLYCKGVTQTPPQQATAPTPAVPPAPAMAPSAPPAPGTAQPTPAPAPSSPVPPPQGQVGGGRVQMVGVIFFAHGSAQMDARDTAVLAEIAKLHRQYGGIVRVIGYASTRTSTTGQVEQEIANLTVSLDRALAIANVLRNNGVPATAVVTEARAGGGPVNQPYMPAGEAGERRAEIYLEY